MSKHVATLNVEWGSGRAESAPTLHSVGSLVQGWYEDFVEERQESQKNDRWSLFQ